MSPTMTLRLSTLACTFAALLAAGLPSRSALAAPVYKCSAGGKVSYGDRPCAQGTSATLPPAPGVAPPGADAVVTGDSRTLLELDPPSTPAPAARAGDEQRSMLAEQRVRQKELQRLQKERLAQEKAERKEQQKLARADASRRKTCARLRLRHKWAEEDAARAWLDAKPAARDAARRKEKRQAEALALECPA
ncbi:hypothetical protein [Massilia forsythiae]|uniref:hypothetical protein n=1 Tax=Massilia forsythiae TaxID=2728020 RepID=UPI001E49DFE2|nr:hypothetical protein [Massilia forsythiae]